MAHIVQWISSFASLQKPWHSSAGESSFQREMQLAAAAASSIEADAVAGGGEAARGPATLPPHRAHALHLHEPHASSKLWAAQREWSHLREGSGKVQGRFREGSGKGYESGRTSRSPCRRARRRSTRLREGEPRRSARVARLPPRREVCRRDRICSCDSGRSCSGRLPPTGCTRTRTRRTRNRPEGPTSSGWCTSYNAGTYGRCHARRHKFSKPRELWQR